MAAGDRMRRVDEAVREVLSDAVTRDLKDPRVGFVTVTDVKTSADLRHARVYVSVLGSDTEQSATIDGLQSAHGYLQARVARQLKMKHTPQLDFILDDTAQKADRLERMLAEMDQERS
jgi:ribosome-binding factor A